MQVPKGGLFQFKDLQDGVHSVPNFPLMKIGISKPPINPAVKHWLTNWVDDMPTIPLTRQHRCIPVIAHYLPTGIITQRTKCRGTHLFKFPVNS
jgi:hypothetical protein